jgi:hypothetical protein
VAESADSLVILSQKNVREIAGPETLAGSKNAGESLLRRDRSIPGLDFTGAGVAVPAGFRQFLAKIAKAHLSSARVVSQKPNIASILRCWILLNC